MSIQSYIKNNLFIIFSCALVVALVVSRKSTPYFIGFWVISAIFEAFQNKQHSFKANLKWGAIVASLFLVYLAAFLFSDFTREASKALEIKASFLIIPLAFILRRKPITNNELTKVLAFFQLACLLSAIYLLAQLIPPLIANTGILTPNGFTYAVRTFAESKLGIHPTYLSIFYLFSVYLTIKGVSLNGLIKNRAALNILKVINLVFLISILLMLVARGPIIGFVIALAVTETIINVKKGLIILIGASISLLFLILFVPSVGNRFKEVINSNQVTKAESSVNSSSLRNSIYSCSKTVISENWFLGVGLDHVQDELNTCYTYYNNTELSEKNYNTHNQYFDILISVGVIGLISFLSLIVYPFTTRNNFNNNLLLFFKLFISVCFITENILSRQHGVVFFVLFTCILISNNIHKNQLSVNNPI